MSEPAWLTLARREVGVREISGARHEQRVLAYFRDVGHAEIRTDETAWCAAFLGACLERSGIRSTRSLRARSYLGWGQALSEPRAGCIVVLRRGGSSVLGHVGFLVARTGPRLRLLGGNQSNSVSIATFPAASVLGYRWPAGAEAAAAPPADAFAPALAHVLRQEGGWSDDPADPGGATNAGITLTTLARHRGVPLTAETAPALREELRRIAPLTIRTIYREDYWLKARCDLLPAGLALMHMDAAVNQGPARACRMLQEAAGVEVDGEIGPLTQAAVADAAERALIERYAEIRRRAYRRLPHFARFGRGWLNRVSATLEAARALATTDGGAASPPPAGRTPPSTPSKETDMTNTAPKWWGRSLTIWGTLVTALTTVLPLVGPFLGLDITAPMIQELGDQTTQALQALGGAIGTALAIYGRLRARSPLQTREMLLRL